MGWSPRTWFNPSPEETLERARKVLARGEPTLALRMLEGVDHAPARELRSAITLHLIHVNLEEWRAQTTAGDRAEARSALERARALGATEVEITAFQRYARAHPE